MFTRRMTNIYFFCLLYDKSGSCGKEITKKLIKAEFQSSSFEIEVSFSVKNMHSLDNNSGSTGVFDFLQNLLVLMIFI